METTAVDPQRTLRGVSRTFALTIPLLPAPLRDVVGNAYLLCRIADTIEDDKALSREQKQEFSERLVRLLTHDSDAAAFARELEPLLSADTAADERGLIAGAGHVIAVTRGFTAAQRAALSRCISIMASGMAYYQQHYGSGDGLPDMASFNHYCYCVAGVVGELLTELFCDYDPGIGLHREQLMRLSILFGQGLQMTNILKDVHEDRARGACWLPRDVFRQAGQGDDAWCAAMLHMVGLAAWHLRQAVRYSLAIPGEQRAVRRFCLWAVGMAVWTLRRMARHPGFSSGSEVKISRCAVYSIGLLVRLFAGSDRMVRFMFHCAARSLPPAPEGLPWRVAA